MGYNSSVYDLHVGNITTGGCTESDSSRVLVSCFDDCFIPTFETSAIINQFVIRAGTVVLLSSSYFFFFFRLAIPILGFLISKT